MSEQWHDRDDEHAERDDVNQNQGHQGSSDRAAPLGHDQSPVAHDATQQTPSAESDPTQQIPATGDAPTERLDPGATGTTWSADPTPTEQVPYAGVGSTDRVAEPAAEQVDQSSRPRGPHAPTVLLGLVCLLVAALVIAYQSADVSIDWSLLGPGAIVGAGGVLVLLGLVGLLARRER